MEYKFSQMKINNQQMLEFKNIKRDYNWRNTIPFGVE